MTIYFNAENFPSTVVQLLQYTMHSYSYPLLILLEGEVSAVGEDMMIIGVSEKEKLGI